ncbi:transport and Golgi organization 2 homolog [Octopus bimaculoides]|nr:transport and Golgi organization 2 homolog [Octopus bimaculoides]|eukprot:XP_014767904.1 PREDICTED: transport and Golgi organization 2 homolog [Octopus bimaculoides]
MDLMEGREGGTWLAVNRNGKLSCLLNIYCEEPDPSKKHRGQLVSDYLNNDQYTAVSYTNTLASLRTDFSPFTIVLMDLSSNEVYCLSNTEDNSEPQLLEPDIMTRNTPRNFHPSSQPFLISISKMKRNEEDQGPILCYWLMETAK